MRALRPEIEKRNKKMQLHGRVLPAVLFGRDAPLLLAGRHLDQKLKTGARKFNCAGVSSPACLLAELLVLPRSWARAAF